MMPLVGGLVCMEKPAEVEDGTARDVTAEVMMAMTVKRRWRNMMRMDAARRR
jgi:hypothetical protein